VSEAAAARPSGAVRIFLYNRPTYLVTWSVAILAMFVGSRLPAPWGTLGIVGLGAFVAVGWSLISLAVSAYVYDRSPLVGARWLAQQGLLPTSVSEWATVHAGLDAEVDVAAVLPGTCLARLDIFDDAIMTPSIARARRLEESGLVVTKTHESVRCSPRALALGDDSCDVVIVAFTAHEIRDSRVREQFFAELHRVLRLGGRVILVEHLRDAANFVAFGPGFVHFLPRIEWIRLAEHASLARVAEVRVTPWVMALALEKSA
jgi:SAM-dependent methyltransferase